MVGMQLRTVEYGIEMVQYPYKILCENLLLSGMFRHREKGKSFGRRRSCVNQDLSLAMARENP